MTSSANTFTYNGDNLRMKKVDTYQTYNYVCDGTSPGSSVLKDSAAVYTPGISERRGTTSQFYHPDTQGSNRTLTDSTQAISAYSLYGAFGGTISWTGSAPVPFRFMETQGYQTDLNSGFLLLGNRYYDPSIGRFISQDPAKAGDNWYAYCDNNPLKETDPLGLDAVGDLLDQDHNQLTSGLGQYINPVPFPVRGKPVNTPLPPGTTLPGKINGGKFKIGDVTIDPVWSPPKPWGPGFGFGGTATYPLDPSHKIGIGGYVSGKGHGIALIYATPEFGIAFGHSATAKGGMLGITLIIGNPSPKGNKDDYGHTF